MKFRDRYLAGLCDIDAMMDYHDNYLLENQDVPFDIYLGLTQTEWFTFLEKGKKALEELLNAERDHRR